MTVMANPAESDERTAESFAARTSHATSETVPFDTERRDGFPPKLLEFVRRSVFPPNDAEDESRGETRLVSAFCHASLSASNVYVVRLLDAKSDTESVSWSIMTASTIFEPGILRISLASSVKR